MVRQNVRFAFRTLRKHPGFAATAITTLALGVALNTTIFSVVNGVLLRPLPYRDADRLVLLWSTAPKRNAFELPTGFRNVQDWRQQSRSFQVISCFRNEPVVLAEQPEPESLEASYVSPDFFSEVGVQPALGRVFTADEAGRGARLAVLSDALWRRRFAASSSAIGRVVRIEGQPATIIGVLPKGFRPLSRETQLWMPPSASSFFREYVDSRDAKWGWEVLARLRPGVRLDQAQAEMSTIAAQLAAAFPESNHDMGVRAIPLLTQITAQIRLALELLFGAVILVLLIACANLGNLLLARAAGRGREVAVRAALGATRRQLISQFLIESAVISFVAGCVGFGLSAFGLKALLAFAPGDVPRLDEVSLDSRALAFTLAVSLLAAILFGLAPSVRLSKGSLSAGHRVSGAARSTRRIRDVLVVAEIALAMVLLSGAGLLVRSLVSVLHVDPGFHAAGVLTVGLHSPAENDPLSPPRFQQLVERLESLPGIESAGGISRYFQANTLRGAVSIEGQASADAASQIDVNYDVIGGHYLQAIGVPLLKGRYFSPQDTAAAPRVVLVNNAFSRALLQEQDPIGKVFHRGGDPTGYTIVGVVGDMRRKNITTEPIPEVLWPHTQRPWGMNLAIRTAGDPLPFVAGVRKAIHDFDGTTVIKSISTLDRQVDDRIAQRRFETWLLSLFATLAVMLAAVGIYGLMHYAVSERMQEIGVRIALGACPRDVFALVLRHAGWLVLIGLTAGLLGTLWGTRMLSTLLYGVSPRDPLTFAAVSLLLAAIALAASAVPACRATRCDPLASLRQE
jgi:predicted permease